MTPVAGSATGPSGWPREVRCSRRSRPTLPAQVIDVRDLAGWIVTCAENRLTGVYDATGPASSLGVMLEEIARSVGGGAELVWVDAGFLQEHDVDLLGRPEVAAAVAARGRARARRARRERCRRRRPDDAADRRHRTRHPRLAALGGSPHPHRPHPSRGARPARPVAHDRGVGVRWLPGFVREDGISYWVPSDSTTSPPLQRGGSGSFAGDPVKLLPARQ